jgi:hypothetical protein
MVSRKIKTNKKSSKSHQKNRKQKSSIILTFLIIGCVVIFFVGIYLFAGEKFDFLSNKSKVDDGKATLMLDSNEIHYDFRKLIGRWLRPDGGYVIDIRKIDADGKVDAGYYNPQPINVSQAEAIGTDTGIKLFIELQDVGYPGSTYTLIYNPQKDMMFGLYYQAAMGQNFDVVFVRTR